MASSLMKKEINRLYTFDDWPPIAKKTARCLAKEGFYYTGSKDTVKCAFCSQCLKNWKYADSPREEHLKHYPTCVRAQRTTQENVEIFPTLKYMAARSVAVACRFKYISVGKHPLIADNVGLPKAIAEYVNEVSGPDRLIESLRCKSCLVNNVATVFSP